MAKVKVLVFVLASLPLACIIWLALQQQLGPNPGKALIHYFAHSAVCLLLLTLSLAPLSRLPRLRKAKQLSRLLGLYSFFYAVLHFLAYLAFTTGFRWAVFAEDITDRPYAYVGMLALVILLLMAVTSTQGWQRRLKRNWKKLHNLVFVALLLIIIHIFWVARSDLIWAVSYGSLAAFLIIWRLFNRWLYKY